MCHRRVFNGEDFDSFSRTPKKKATRKEDVCMACARGQERTHTSMFRCMPVNSGTQTNADVHTYPCTPSLPVGLFYHIIIVGRGSLALCCSPKAACNVSRDRK